MTNTRLAFEYKGYNVSLTATFLFEVAGSGEDDHPFDRFYETAQAARDAIDRRVKAQERQAVARARLAIEAVDDLGEPCTIRGINANTSALLGAPAGGSRYIYPAVPWVVAEIKRWRQLQDSAIEAYHRLGKYRLNGKAGYGRVDPSRYDDLVASFEREFAEKKAAAEAQGGAA